MMIRGSLVRIGRGKWDADISDVVIVQRSMQETWEEFDVHKGDAKLFILYHLFTDNIQHEWGADRKDGLHSYICKQGTQLSVAICLDRV